MVEVRSNQMKRVLFVCMGNICRSPAGEAVLQKRVDEQNLNPFIEIDSAGTHDYHIGELPDPRMRQAGQRRGYSFVTRARQVTREDLNHFDLILAMDHANLSRIQCLGTGGTAEVRLLSHFLDENWEKEVPDPYYGGPQGFEHVLDMLEAACPAIIAHLVNEPGSS